MKESEIRQNYSIDTQVAPMCQNLLNILQHGHAAVLLLCSLR